MTQIIKISLLTLFLTIGTLGVYADQPNMDAAMGYLKNAKSALEKANDNKGGHRVNAIKLVDNAIKEVQKGIDAAKAKK